jgi:enoyl-CoA hydratase
MSRALDLILTGRPVEAEEAHAIGLVHRVVPSGEAQTQAEALARMLTQFPQNCLRSDRQSVYEQAGDSLENALWNEFRRGQQVLESREAHRGAQRFRDGRGRHGQFDDL